MADTDYPLLDPNLLILDAKWRMWQIKGFDYTPMQMEARDYTERSYANDGGAKTLNMTRGAGTYGWSTGIIQDGNYPSGNSGY
jgi:hypothetical protein